MAAYGGVEMSKAVMISIRPKWCEKICSGEKTIEVRKTRPKLETPFKCHIYETQGKTDTPWVDEDGHMIFSGRGKVIGEFTCDRIYEIRKRGIPENFDYCYLSLNGWGNDDIEVEIKAISASCVSKEELNTYGTKAPFLYGWHISNLKIYDTPKELGEFERPYECDLCTAKWASECNACHDNGKIKRPPQSWCYVEEM